MSEVGQGVEVKRLTESRLLSAITAEIHRRKVGIAPSVVDYAYQQAQRLNQDQESQARIQNFVQGSLLAYHSQRIKVEKLKDRLASVQGRKRKKWHLERSLQHQFQSQEEIFERRRERLEEAVYDLIDTQIQREDSLKLGKNGRNKIADALILASPDLISGTQLYCAFGPTPQAIDAMVNAFRGGWRSLRRSAAPVTIFLVLGFTVFGSLKEMGLWEKTNPIAVVEQPAKLGRKVLGETFGETTKKAGFGRGKAEVIKETEFGKNVMSKVERMVTGVQPGYRPSSFLANCLEPSRVNFLKGGTDTISNPKERNIRCKSWLSALSAVLRENRINPEMTSETLQVRWRQEGEKEAKGAEIIEKLLISEKTGEALPVSDFQEIINYSAEHLNRPWTSW